MGLPITEPRSQDQGGDMWHLKMCTSPRVSFSVDHQQATLNNLLSWLLSLFVSVLLLWFQTIWEEGDPPNCIDQLLMKLVGMSGTDFSQKRVFLASSLKDMCVQAPQLPWPRSFVFPWHCRPQTSPYTATSIQKQHHWLFLTWGLPCMQPKLSLRTFYQGQASLRPPSYARFTSRRTTPSLWWSNCQPESTEHIKGRLTMMFCRLCIWDPC